MKSLAEELVTYRKILTEDFAGPSDEDSFEFCNKCKSYHDPKDIKTCKENYKEEFGNKKKVRESSNLEDADPKPFPGASIYDSGESESEDEPSEDKDEKDVSDEDESKEEDDDTDKDTDTGAKKPAKADKKESDKKESDKKESKPAKKEKKADKLEVYKQLRDAHDAAKEALYSYMKEKTIKYKPEEEKISIGKDHFKKLMQYALSKEPEEKD